MIAPIKPRSISLDALLSMFFLAAVVQAFSANLLKINFPVTQLLVLLMCSVVFLGFGKVKGAVLLVAFVAFCCLLSVLLCGFFIGGEEYQELLYQVFAVFLLLAFSAFFSRAKLSVNSNRSLPWLRGLVVLYCFFSLVIHFYFWEEVAVIFYGRENNFGGLLMDGRIPRMYGLLFNPLSSAFSALILLVIFYVANVRDKTLYLLLSLIVVFALSRSAILLLVLFIGYCVFVRCYKVLLLLSFPVFLIFMISVGLDSVGLVIDGILKDETGSIREHILNYKIGLVRVASLYGEGFVDARDYGAWNIRLESMPLQFAFTGGGVVFFSLMLSIFLCLYFLVSRFGLKRSAPVFLLLPLVFSFPLHTFNFPIFLLAFLLCVWMPDIVSLKEDGSFSIV